MENQTPNPNPPQTPGDQPGYNPLGGKVDEKNYTTTNQFSPHQLAGDIPEPAFTPPPIDITDIPSREDGLSGKKEKAATGSAKPAAPAGFNEQLTELDDKDKQKAAEAAAVSIVGLYKGAHILLNNSLKISEKKVQRMVMEGELDLSVPVPYDLKQDVPMSEFIREYNHQCSDALVVDPEFEAKVIPLLTHILAKNGHGMTPEGQLAFVVGQDLLMKGFKWFEMKGQTKRVLDFAREQTSLRLARYRPKPVTVPAPEVVPNEAAAPAPVVQMAPPPPSAVVQEEPPMVAQTLQDRAIQNVSVSADRSSLPELGDPGRLATMDAIYQQELKERDKKDRVRHKLHGHGTSVPQPKKRKTGTPQPGGAKKGPGRPKGSTKDKLKAIKPNGSQL